MIYFATRSITYFIIALSLSIAVLLLRHSPIVSAADEVFLANAQYDRAARLDGSKLPIDMLFVGFDDDYCVAPSGGVTSNYATLIGQSGCDSSDAIAREDITRVLKLARTNSIDTILLDLAFEPRGCDPTTFALVETIIDVSSKATIVLPVRTLPDGPVKSFASTIFDHCKTELSQEQREFVTHSGRILFGHGIVSSVGHSNYANYVPDFYLLDRPADHGFGRRLVPSVALLTALSVVPLETSTSFDSDCVGLKGEQLFPEVPVTFTSRTSANPIVEPHQRYESLAKLLDTRKQCFDALPSVRSDLKQAISYRVMPERLTGHSSRRFNFSDRYDRFHYLSAQMLSSENMSTFLQLKNDRRNVLVIGANSSGFRDNHDTPIGRVSGPFIHINAVVDYIDGGADRFASFIEILVVDLATVTAFTIFIFLLSNAIYFSSERFLKNSNGGNISKRLVHNAAVVSGCILLFYMVSRNAISDFENNVVTFAIFSVFLIVTDLKTSIEEVTHMIIEKIVRSFSTSEDAPKPGSEVDSKSEL